MSSECLCQQLKINPDPTHGENWREREWEVVCGLQRMFPSWVTFVHRIRSPSGDRVQCPALRNAAQERVLHQTNKWAQFWDGIFRVFPNLILRFSLSSIAFAFTATTHPIEIKFQPKDNWIHFAHHKTCSVTSQWRDSWNTREGEMCTSWTHLDVPKSKQRNKALKTVLVRQLHPKE